MNHKQNRNNDDNPFGSEHRKGVLEEMLKNGLVKRITLIEGNYPTNREQDDFIRRISRWLGHK